MTVPKNTITGQRDLAKPLGLDARNVDTQSLTAALNLMYRIMVGNGILNHDHFIETPLGTLKARRQHAAIALETMPNSLMLSAQALHSGEISPLELMQTGGFLGALRALGNCTKTSQGCLGGGGKNEAMLIAFESKAQLVKAINKLAAQFPEVSILGDNAKPCSALELLNQMNSQLTKCSTNTERT